jgi:branched-chain amino acid transport system ATP-binding protein
MASGLEVRDLCKRYGGIVVADAVSFSVQRGECLGVIGPNGAGKSSLFNLIAGTVRADSGSICVDGHELLGLAAHARARLGIARAFQIPQPFAHLSVYENVLAAATFAGGARGTAAGTASMRALERTGLAACADQPAARLPLLDRKRLELARALAAMPRVLLLDEIAGGLTEGEVQEMSGLVRELSSSHCIIWIEHIPQALHAACDRIMVLHFGRKLLEAAPREAMSSALVREIYMGLADSDDRAA